MKVSFSVLADAANISSDNKFNLLGVFQAYYASSVPTTLSQLALALIINADSQETGIKHKLEIVFKDPDNLEVAALPEMPFEIPTSGLELKTELLLIFNITNLQLPKFGESYFDVLLNGKVVKRIPLLVVPVGEDKLRTSAPA